MRKFIYTIVALFMPVCMFAQVDAEHINESIKKQYAPDSRQALWEVTVKTTAGGVVAKGKTTEQEAYDAFKSLMNNNKIDYIDSITVYPNACWGLVRISVASLRAGSKHSAEIVSQALMGTPLRLLEHVGEWWRVQSPDGYISYVPESSIVEKTQEQMNDWRQAERLIVKSLDQIRVYAMPNDKAYRNMVTDLVNGCIVEGELGNDKIEVSLPDGRKGWLNAADVESVNDWANQGFDSDKILETAYSLMGTPYLWGGMSPKALDCSGLARVCYFANGIILMRDASQQAKTGQRIEPENWRECKSGDLLYFGNAKTKRVTHVGIYDKNGGYVHSSGRVKYNSVDPEAPEYLKTPFLLAVRVDGQIGTKGIISAANHPWYFNID